MTPIEKNIIETIEELLAIKHPRLVIELNNLDGISRLEPYTHHGGAPCVLLRISSSRTQKNLDSLAEVLAKTFSALDNIRKIQENECSHPDFKEKIENIVRWSKNPIQLDL